MFRLLGLISILVGQTGAAENKTAKVCVCGKMDWDKNSTAPPPYWPRFDPYKALVSLNAKFPKYFNETKVENNKNATVLDDEDLKPVPGIKERPRPWLALLKKRRSKGPPSFCGGTLINHWYVITASHCVCPTDYSDREKLKTCNEGKERIKLHSNYPIQIDICLAVSDERECQMDIEYDRAYRVTELVVRKERLAKDNLKTFDIALLKLDRRVRFNSDVSPICLPGALDFKKPANELAFVSGFGNTEYSPEKDNKAECGTDMFLPRPYHSCAGTCHKSNPPIDSLDETICSWLIYKNMDSLLKLRLDVLRVNIQSMGKFIICYPNINPFGWCTVNETVSHKDFNGMPTWGHCDGACVVEMDENGQFAFESLSGVSFWAEQYLISYKDCVKYLKGMTGSKDPKLLENFDPKTELCAGKIFKLRLQDFRVDNLTITRENIQGTSTQIGEPTNPLPHFIGGTDTCQGDSGGPLWRWQALQKNSSEERVVQIGIIARGDKCARVNRPGIYTKLSSFRKWIKKNTQDGECDKFE